MAFTPLIIHDGTARRLERPYRSPTAQTYHLQCTLCGQNFSVYEPTQGSVHVSLKSQFADRVPALLTAELCPACAPKVTDLLLQMGALRCLQHRYVAGSCEVCGAEYEDPPKKVSDETLADWDHGKRL